MAKKGLSTGSKNSFFDLVSKIDNSVEILSESETAVIGDYIDTGNYMLNAAMTGSIFKGVPTGRVLTVSGDPQTGKSFLALSICRNAQKKGYTPVYLDSEGAIDKGFVERLGCDPDNFLIKQVTTVREVATFLANLTKNLMELPEEDRYKVVVVLDSIGNLTSDKELTDTLEGNNKADMTRAKEIKALFRTNTTSLAKLGIPMIVCAHQYLTQDFMPKAVVSGGSGISYNSSITIMLTTAKLDDKESDEAAKQKTGDFVKTGVLVSAKPAKSRFTIPQKIKFQIPFFKEPNPYVGLEAYLDWETCGVLRGKILTEKEYGKLSDSDKQACYPFEGENGATVYAMPKETSRNIVVRHLKKELPLIQLWSSDVFTDEVLHLIDENKIKPNFELPTHGGDDDIKELVETE